MRCRAIKEGNLFIFIMRGFLKNKLKENFIRKEFLYSF